MLLFGRATGKATPERGKPAPSTYDPYPTIRTMPKKITVVVSQGQSKNPAKCALEEDVVTALLMEKGIEVTVVPHLYDLKPDGTGMLCLQGIAGDMVVVSWLYPRAAHWILDRNRVQGRMGTTLLKHYGADDEEGDHDEEAEADSADENSTATAAAGSNRAIYCLDLRAYDSAAPYVEEIKRIASEATTQTVGLMNFIGGSPKPEQLGRYLNPFAGNVESNGNGASKASHNGHGAGAESGNGQPLANPAVPTAASAASGAEASAAPIRIDEEGARRWYPVIDFSRCTNCMECLDFCLFGVYGVDRVENILVEQPDNCRKGCPACSRVCPENAIIFPQHKSPAIAGSPEQAEGGFKIDLSKLFGAPEGVDQAVAERDEQLVLAGRDAVGATVGVPKRQADGDSSPKDELDSLIDELDDLDL